MSQFTYKNTLFFLFILCCISANTYAQKKPKKEKTRLIQPIAEGKITNSDSITFYKIVPIDESNGVVVISNKNKVASYQITQFDTSLKNIIKTVDIPISAKYEYISAMGSENKLYILFAKLVFVKAHWYSERNFKKYIAVEVNLTSGEIKIVKAKFSRPFSYTSIDVVKNKMIVMGDVTLKNAGYSFRTIATYSSCGIGNLLGTYKLPRWPYYAKVDFDALKASRNKISYGRRPKTHMLSYCSDEDKNQISLIIKKNSSRKGTKQYIHTIDINNTKNKIKKIKFDVGRPDKSEAYTAKATTLNDGNKIVVGSYGNRQIKITRILEPGIPTEGVYIVKTKGNDIEWTTSIPYDAIFNFKYNKGKLDPSQGRRIQEQYKFEEVIEQNNQYIFVGTSYTWVYPLINFSETPLSFIQTSKGFKILNCIVFATDKNGKLLWTSGDGFKLPEYTSYFVPNEPMVVVNPFEDGVLVSLITNNNLVEHFYNEDGEDNKNRHIEYTSDLCHWYDDYYLLTGENESTQIEDDDRVKSRRYIYLHKIKSLRYEVK
ncbi:MAG: hypothetical protein WCK82_10065 [Bacteroidota bacterium]